MQVPKWKDRRCQHSRPVPTRPRFDTTATACMGSPPRPAPSVSRRNTPRYVSSSVSPSPHASHCPPLIRLPRARQALHCRWASDGVKRPAHISLQLPPVLALCFRAFSSLACSVRFLDTFRMPHRKQVGRRVISSTSIRSLMQPHPSPNALVRERCGTTSTAPTGSSRAPTSCVSSRSPHRCVKAQRLRRRTTTTESVAKLASANEDTWCLSSASFPPRHLVVVDALHRCCRESVSRPFRLRERAPTQHQQRTRPHGCRQHPAYKREIRSSMFSRLVAGLVISHPHRSRPIRLRCAKQALHCRRGRATVQTSAARGSHMSLQLPSLLTPLHMARAAWTRSERRKCLTRHGTTNLQQRSRADACANILRIKKKCAQISLRELVLRSSRRIARARDACSFSFAWGKCPASVAWSMGSARRPA